MTTPKAQKILTALDERPDLRDEVLRSLVRDHGDRVCTPWEDDREPEPWKPRTDGPWWPLAHRRDLRGRAVATVFKAGRFRIYNPTGEIVVDTATHGGRELVDALLANSGFILLGAPEVPT